MDRKQVLNEIIVAYRAVIKERYDFEYLSSRYTLPTSFDKEKVDTFRRYFLEHIYPNTTKREALNNAFLNLDQYIRKPDKLLRLILDSTKLLFKYGRHLPKILSTAIKAMKSFRVANQFENRLVEIAVASKKQAPYSIQQINDFIGELSKSEIDNFVESSQSLFETLYDRKLVLKILDVVKFLIIKMKGSPSHYSTEEVNALQLGFDLIESGNSLFEQLETKDQEAIINFVIKVEKENLSQIFDQ